MTTTSTPTAPVHEVTVRIGSAKGLHARPAKLVSQAAAACGAKVTLTTEAGKTVNLASILGLISLGLPAGADVTLATDGLRAGLDAVDASALLHDLSLLLAADHDGPSADETAA